MWGTKSMTMTMANLALLEIGCWTIVLSQLFT